MARLFGYYANQSDRILCALTLDAEGVATRPDMRIDGWGLGSYQAGEVLLRNRPAEQRDEVRVLDLVRELRTDCAIVHIRPAAVGNRSYEATHPFRFRQWLFAHNGAIPGFADLRATLMERLPDFLARNARRETDSELVFLLFLAFVHETGRLDDPELDRRAISDALRQTLQFLDAASLKLGQPPAVLNCIVSNHHAMVALRRGLPMAWVRRHGIRDCVVCRKQPEMTGREPKRVDHEAFKYILVASDHAPTPKDWFDLPASDRGTILAIDRDLDAQVSEL